MDLRTLRYCEAIARLGSITRAAEVLYVAQPALSVAVRKLEDELGVTLFSRQRNRRVTPTPEGEILLKRAARLFQEIESARQELADVRALRSGEVRIGMPPMYGMKLFPALLAQFRAQHAGLFVTAVEGSAGEVGGMLDRGEIDLAILEARRVRKSWQSTGIGEEEMVLAVARTHPLADRHLVTADDLRDLDLLVLDESFLQRNVLDDRARKRGVRYRAVLQSNYVPLLHDAAAHGLGATTSMRSIVAADLRLVALSFDPPEVFRFALCWLEERYLSRANVAFIEFMKTHAAAAAPGGAPKSTRVRGGDAARRRQTPPDTRPAR